MERNRTNGRRLNDTLEVSVARLEERLQASEKALDLAREYLEHWQAASNEWRQENVDQRSQYMTIDKAMAVISAEGALRSALEARLNILEQTATEKRGSTRGSKMVWALVLTVLTLIVGIAGILIRFIGK